MNGVQPYNPPRILALILGALVLAAYQFFWRGTLMVGPPPVETVPQALSVLLSFIVGYGIAMLFWLINQTKGQIWPTFRPTSGRIIAAVVVAMLMPVVVFSYLPWIVGGLLIFMMAGEPLVALAIAGAATAIAYPITSMIVRHTYDRRVLRFGMFCVMFWAGYSAFLLLFGVHEFSINF